MQCGFQVVGSGERKERNACAIEGCDRERVCVRDLDVRH